MINEARRLLINVGKMLPFIVCAIVAVSYIETATSMLFERIVYYGDFATPYKPISWFISRYFEYDWLSVTVMLVISIAIETCIYNKLACLYLGINLVEKSYFDFELEPTTIYIICIVNIIVAGYLTVKGIKILLK